MKSFKEFNIVNILTWVLIILTFFLVIKFNWQRRWLYYHGSKFHGSLTFSLIGQIKLIAGGYTGFMGNLMEFVRVNPPIFKFWMAGDLFIINSRPESVEILLEELIAIRTFRIWLHPKFFWELSSFSKEMHKLSRITLDFTEQVVWFRHPKYLSNSWNVFRNVLEETQIMMITASETTALVLSFTLLVLGIHTEVQEKICAELDSIFGSSTRDATLEDINRMDYLERVMKESMRLLPPIPMIVRFLDKDVKIDQHVFPKRSSLLVPILHMNRRPELWDDPLTFNPDRFLPEQSKNRPRCAYIPFSFGFRNCIGLQYGMISVKAILSTFLRRYEVGSVNYKSIADIEMIFTELAKPKDNCEILLKSRN
ncbi:p450 domain containing protein [Asbolus verrucosus]|uniref:p450 domain containing protein n=1 Tax=Asbolus verrucosus TaxID=1661398 RepID=A0A482W3N7_ASBVE|nr:p450 domain containing protein [Asbolus verrucosus]